MKLQGRLRDVNRRDASFSEDWAFDEQDGFFIVTQGDTSHLYKVDMETLSSRPISVDFRPLAINYCAPRKTFFISDHSGNLYLAPIKDGEITLERYDYQTALPSEKNIWNVVYDETTDAILALVYLHGEPTQERGYRLFYKPLVESGKENWLPIDFHSMDAGPSNILIDTRNRRLYIPFHKGHEIDIWDTSAEIPNNVGRISLDLQAPIGRVRINPNDGSLWVFDYGNNLFQLSEAMQLSKSLQPHVKQVTTGEGINDFDISLNGKMGVTACTYTHRIALIDLLDPEKKSEYINVDNPGRTKFIGDRIYVKGHTSEGLYLFE